MSGWGRFVLVSADTSSSGDLVAPVAARLSTVAEHAGVVVLGDAAVVPIAVQGHLVVVAGELHGFDGAPVDDIGAIRRALADAVVTGGAAAYDRVLGDVVVLLVDPDGSVEVFREVTGARPAFVGSLGGTAVVASDWYDLARGTGEVRPDRHWVAHYVAGTVCYGPICPDERFAQVLPGQAARWERDSPTWRLREVSRIRPRRAPRRESPESAALRFREAVDESIRARARPGARIAVSLSGGLDSTSVLVSGAAAAPGTSWHGFAIPFSSPEGDERQRQRAVAEAAKAELRWVPLDGRGPFGRGRGYTEHLERHGAPSLVPNWFMLDAVADAAVADGLDRVMGGEDPDSLLGYFGFSHLSDLAVRLHWRTWWAEASVLRSLYRRSYRSLGRLSYELARPPRPFLGEALRVPEMAGADTFVCPSPRRARRWRPGRMFDEVRREALRPAHLARVQDEAARAFRGRDLPVSQPLMDRRVVEVAAGLPWRDVVRAGVAKQVLRRAMVGRLPEEVRTRTVKAVLSAPDTEAISGWQKGLVVEGLNAARDLPDWFDPAEVTRLLADVESGSRLTRAARLARLALWLRWCSHGL